MNKVGIKNACADYFWGEEINVASNWYIGIMAYDYGFNDSTMQKVYINSNNWLLPDIDPETDKLTGTGLYLGSGCSSQRWLGGKIEWNGTGVIIEPYDASVSATADVNYMIQISNFMFDHNTKWAIRYRNSVPATISTKILISNNQFGGAGFALDATHSAHIFLDGDGDDTAALYGSIVGNTFAYSPIDSPYPYASGTKYPTYASILANNGGALKLSIVANSFRDAASTNQILIDDSVGAGSLIEESGNEGNFTWNIDASKTSLYSKVKRLIVGGQLTPTTPQPDPYTIEVSDAGLPTKVLIRASSSQSGEDVFNTAGNDYTIYTRITSGGIQWMRGLKTYSDIGDVVTFGRYDSGYAGAVVDWADPTGGAANPTFASLRIAGNERVRITARGIQLTGGFASPTSTATCSVGEIVFDASYVYVCYATDTWKRATLSAY